MGPGPHVRLIYPHQVFTAHLDAAPGTLMLLVEDDLYFRQLPFHAQKLVLHRASMDRFAERLRDAGFDVETLRTDRHRPTPPRLTEAIRTLAPSRVSVYDVVDDFLSRSCVASLADAGYTLGPEDVLETPNFLTTRAQIDDWFAGGHRARMQAFYTWQRRRLDVLVEGQDPVGGQWSFDPENRKKLPRGHVVPGVTWPQRHPAVTAAIAWVAEEFPDAPGDAESFAWPTSHDEADAMLAEFLDERLAQFGPYEDAIARAHPFVYHAAMSPGLNIGLLDPADVLERVLEAGHENTVPLASLEGFVRQLIGWREYMRATYRRWGRRMRTSNALGHTRSLDHGWWTGETGLDPVDHVIGGVLERGWAHHIERLMVLGNAMCLQRVDPVDVHEWFMAMFVDAYDWVMVPNVHAMSQYAAGSAITTKPYVSGSHYLTTMSDFGPGEWRADWDGLYWSFVDDHRDTFAANHRSTMVLRHLEGMDDATLAGHRERAAPYLAN
ncbi:cryptochrome/photolyase family protein [Tersicoccus solisilvae]|uniref:Cryptochrome/photolyase family protein n=1 Tax=Tersicoccus solisilvae TaxID=1882339 RepID=A0ABQ1PER9_9MICC|nr:cryptochrome/photolyase family protein [Tersicoccus solisilvae]GGC95819.1 cryptochrome/photolyase family protein [Tersicoccus solisilvae]